MLRSRSQEDRFTAPRPFLHWSTYPSRLGKYLCNLEISCVGSTGDNACPRCNNRPGALNAALIDDPLDTQSTIGRWSMTPEPVNHGNQIMQLQRRQCTGSSVSFSFIEGFPRPWRQRAYCVRVDSTEVSLLACRQTQIIHQMQMVPLWDNPSLAAL